jgi:hypothetical protein
MQGELARLLLQGSNLFVCGSRMQVPKPLLRAFPKRGLTADIIHHGLLSKLCLSLKP